MHFPPMAPVFPWVRRRVGPAAIAVTLLAGLGAFQPLEGQLGAIEAFARRVTDVSFYVNTGGLLPGSDEVRTGSFGLASYGLELLFEIGSVSRPLPEARETEGDSVALTWVQTTVTQHDDHTDTTDVFEVERVERRTPSETIWLFELGLGYGQMVGFDGARPSTDLRGTIRDLPSVSFYASYEPLGGYFGLRSGFMRLNGLQFFDEVGVPFGGKAESFLAAGLVGYAMEILGFNLFAETGYSLRHFPSIVWSGGALPQTIPRELNLSGWFFGGGIQFQIAQ